jgi:hypothetical protein
MMGTLTRYCQTNHQQVWVVSSSALGVEQAKKILRDNQLDTDARLSLLTLESALALTDIPDLIIVFEPKLQLALATSKALNRYKKLEIPVVFGNARDVFFEYPNISQQGISYAGMFQLCAAYIEGQKALAGTPMGYAEFGVFDGRTCSLAWQIFNGFIEDFYAFDSFKGILDKADGEELYYESGDYYANQATFNLNMELCGVEMARMHPLMCDFDRDLIKGIHSTKIKQPLAIVHIDCDVYPAALNVLEFVTPHLAQGCILLFDDYDSMWGDSNKGEKRALTEWRERYPEFIVSEYRSYSATGKAFLCYKTSAF